MRTDAVVVGAELEALVAAVRLTERGMSVRLLATGAGSLHYAPGGLQLLGFSPIDPHSMVADPFEGLGALHSRHPLRLIGMDRTKRALDWFLDLMKRTGSLWHCDRRNKLSVTMAGVVPVLAHPRAQATLNALDGKRVAVVMINGHRDFSGDLAMSHLRRRDVDARLVGVDPPSSLTDNVALGTALDSLDTATQFFRDVRRVLPRGTDVVLFPAILGLHWHESISEVADQILGARAFEVPTVPPSVPGIRLYRTLMRQLEASGALVHMGARHLKGEIVDGHCRAVCDSNGYRYEATVFIAGTGGVLMGGLEVDSHGQVFEPTFGLPVHQTSPLALRSHEQVVEALHRAGVDVDPCLRPLGPSGNVIEHLFVTGSTLAHWNPCREGSGEGVAVATGWAAAEQAVAYGRA